MWLFAPRAMPSPWNLQPNPLALGHFIGKSRSKGVGKLPPKRVFTNWKAQEATKNASRVYISVDVIPILLPLSNHDLFAHFSIFGQSETLTPTPLVLSLSLSLYPCFSLFHKISYK